MKPVYGRILLAPLLVATALALSGCNCGWFALDEYSCDGAGADCGVDRTCVESDVTQEWFCVAADAGVSLDASCFCDDGDPCNGIESCDPSGSCVPGTPVDCTMMGDVCNAGTCDPGTGMCTKDPLPDGTTCDDGFFCTEPDGCEAGVCTGPPRDCSGAGDICNSGGCDEATDMCTGAPLPNGDPCNDGMFCTVGETCQSSVCTGGTARDCSAVADQCNADSCNDTTDLCEPTPVMDGTGCDDGLFCSTLDSCQGGLCTAGPAVDCTAMDGECTIGVCDELADTCAPNSANETLACDDMLACTTGTTCTSGVCTNGSPTDCSGLDDVCIVGVCDEAMGGCIQDLTMLNGNMCDDGNSCTTSDMCSGGMCGGAPAACDFTCGPSGCVLASNVPVIAYSDCSPLNPALTPPSGATVTVGAGSITCSPSCDGAGTTSIPLLTTIVQGGGDPDIALFCVSAMDIPGNVTVTFTLNEAVLFLVDGAANIDGTLDATGGDAISTAEGLGGPGGYDGRDLTSSATGLMGNGPCGGSGGGRINNDGAGGGGGGHGGTGGDGGDAYSGSATAGGTGGGTCGMSDLSPLTGGSSGATGADGSSGTTGWPSGGGGGAIQIASRVSITISGTIDTSGGAGYGSGSSNGGGGGGGAGGGILLEAPTINVTGSLVCDGGAGGVAEAGSGGTGASGGTIAGGDGTDATSGNNGGPGGGGGGGRIRLHSSGGTATCGGFASPTASCTDGAL